MKKNLPVMLLAIASLAAGFAVYHYTNEQPVKNASANIKQPVVKKSISIVGTKRADFSLFDLQGKKRHIREWDGRVILLNFWATWCPPCRRELPAFIELQEQYGARGFQVLGIAIDEKQAVIDYIDGLGGNYPIMIGGKEVLAISAAYGNRFGQLPYSLVIDRKGIIRFVGKHELSFKDIEKQIQPLL